MVVLEESEMAMDRGGVRLVSSRLATELEGVLAEGNTKRGAGRNRRGSSKSWMSRVVMRCSTARIRSSVWDLEGNGVRRMKE